MDMLSMFLNHLIERIHPWHPIRFRAMIHASRVEQRRIEITIGTVAAFVEWNPDSLRWELRYPGDSSERSAFIQRISDILDGKVRDAEGRMVEPAEKE